MIPPLNPMPCPPNKLQPHGTPGSVSQQGIQSNQFQGKPAGFNQNPAMFQAQTGMMMNQQMPMPFNNFVPNMGNGSPAMPPIANVNGNPYIAMHHALSMLGMPHLAAQGQMSFGPPGSNPIPFVPMPMNQNQPHNQLHPNPPVNMPQFYNQNACFPNQQMCLPSPMQNNNQFMTNNGQGVPSNMPPYPNQNFQPLGIQKPFGTGQPNGSMPQGNQSQNMLVPPPMNANSARNTPSVTQPLQGNSSLLPPATNSVTPRNAQQHFGPPGFSNPQMNGKRDSENNHPCANWKNSQNKHSGKNTRQDAFQRRLPNGNFQKGKRNFNQHGGHDKKGHKNGTFNNTQTKTSWPTIAANQSNASQTRDQDLSQWLEERKKNFPSKANIEKKQAETNPAVVDSSAILRSQQLKQILARQAELGVEVADIPEHYLIDTDKPANGKQDEGQSSFQRGNHGRGEQNGKPPKRGKHKNKVNKRERRNDKNRSNKKQKADNDDSAKEKTLLQKLLGEDIRKEKIHLLQVFRFMTMNSFFKEWPEKPLLFPSVTVNEAGLTTGVVAERKPQSVVGSGSENVKNSNNGDEVVGVKKRGNRIGDVYEEEEGEIID
ncbi:uncharacterized protein LOC124919743 [Impatiens glandulifera]|uniref:uncharacterized protein LOC124919743 n=1 Tax=Impatiens glandulifera TaxID=253017 RepID=UPI001FB16E5B|nr:uncharacterized protein LOC124919743 [Impatiens glandulifera]